MPFGPGARLGPYHILAAIGSGGMGEVYRGVDTRLGRTVAVKILTAALTRDLEARERFRREARAASSLSHPHICTLFDVGHQDSVDYLVMEYVDGETLAARLARGPLPIDMCLFLVPRRSRTDEKWKMAKTACVTVGELPMRLIQRKVTVPRRRTRLAPACIGQRSRPSRGGPSSRRRSHPTA
jgi:Protein kinase domain